MLLVVTALVTGDHHHFLIQRLKNLPKLIELASVCCQIWDISRIMTHYTKHSSLIQ